MTKTSKNGLKTKNGLKDYIIDGGAKIFLSPGAGTLATPLITL